MLTWHDKEWRLQQKQVMIISFEKTQGVKQISNLILLQLTHAILNKQRPEPLFESIETVTAVAVADSGNSLSAPQPC
jgi:hypothetical protein